MPARSTCSKMPGMTMSSPSNTASTSTSVPARYLSTSSGALGWIGGALSAYAASCASLYTISMPRPPSTYDGRTRTGNPISRAISRALRNDSAALPGGRGGARVPGAGDAEFAEHGVEFFAVFGEIERTLARPQDFYAAGRELARQIDGRLTAEGKEHPVCARGAHRLLDFVDARRLEDQHV